MEAQICVFKWENLYISFSIKINKNKVLESSKYVFLKRKPIYFFLSKNLIKMGFWELKMCIFKWKNLHISFSIKIGVLKIQNTCF